MNYKQLLLFQGAFLLLIFSVSGQQVTWTNLTGVTVGADNTLTKTAGYGSTNGIGYSEEQLAASTDGWAEMTVVETNTMRHFGLCSPSNVANNSTIDYAIMVSSSNLDCHIYENGTKVFYAGKYAAGMVIRIERVGNTITYQKDGVVFYTSSVPSTSALMVKSSILHTGGTIANAKFFNNNIPLSAPDNLTATEPAAGEVLLNWNDNSSDETGFELERSLSAADGYSLIHTAASDETTYLDATVAPNTSYYYRVRAIKGAETSDNSTPVEITTSSPVGNPAGALTWTNLTGVSVSPDNTLTKTAGYGSTNGIGYSEEQLAASTDGWAEMTVGETNASRHFGLCSPPNVANNSTIDYAIMLSSSNLDCHIYENGTKVFYAGKYAAGMVIRIERVGNTITYQKDGVVFYTSSSSSNSSLFVKSSILHTGGTIAGANVSFGVGQENTLPVLSVIEDVVVIEGQQTTINLSATDGDNDPLAFTLNTTASFISLIDHGDGTAALKIAPGYLIAGEYSATITVDDENGGEDSETFMITVNSNPGGVPAPGDFTFDAWTSSSISLSWKHSAASEVGYHLERSVTSGTGFTLVEALPTNTTSYVDQNLEADQLYFYRIKALLPDNTETGYSEEIRVKTSGIVSVDTELLHKRRYNGNISAVKWKNYDSENEKIYTYHYDASNRIKAAQYAEGYTEAGVWTTTTASLGGFSVDDISYDHNGNILTLERQTLDGTAKSMDALSYAYQGNQLISVIDEVGSQGFADRNIDGDDYEYDANGNLTKDLNQGILLITYNHLNLPDRIDFENGDYIIYVYDASGSKLAEERYDAADQLLNQKDYMGAFLYENETLQFIHHEEGRIVPGLVPGSPYEYEYHLRDHLGNTRLTLSTKPKEYIFVATFETDDLEIAEEEETMFSHIPETREISLAADANDDGGNEVVRLNGTQPMGAGISLPVSPGDLISMKVDGYYEGGTDYSNQVGLAAFVSAIAGGFGGINGGTEAQQATYNALNNAFGEIGMLGTSDNNVPAAYLNYILFDKNMDSYQHGHTQITSDANMDHLLMTINNIKVTKVGFVYVYLSNESASPNWVYFDDFEVTLKEFGVVQSDDYYPFGLTFNHYQQVSGKENKYLYQGKERLADTDWYDFHARGYSPTLGRFMQIDPKYNGPSGYIGMLNNPLGNVDPSGEEPISITTAIIISVAVSAVSYTAAIAFSPGGFDNWDWHDFSGNLISAVGAGMFSFGVGEIYQGAAAVSSANKTLVAIGKSATHATVQGSISFMEGGDFGSSFVSGFAGGLAGSAGNALNAGAVGTVATGMLMGGAGAEFSGGDFWRGAAVGGIVAGANEVAHKVGASVETKIREDKEKQTIGKVNLSGSPDEVFNGLVDKYDKLFAGIGLHKPNDGRKLNYYNINDIVTNPPDYHTGSTSAKLTSPELFTKAGVKFRWAISPPEFQKAANYQKGYLYQIEHNAGSKIAQIHFIGRDNHAVLTLTIYGRENFKPILEKIYNGSRDF